jgi:hypothetical protein
VKKSLRLLVIAVSAVMPLALALAPAGAVAGQHAPAADAQELIPLASPGGHGGPGSTVELTAEQTEHLRFVRDEERMALELYTGFAAIYRDDPESTAIFDRIANSEQDHFDAVGRMLDKYGVADPAAGMDVGEYDNTPVIQALYDTLWAKGQLSWTDALEVGVEVEETDIEDIGGILAEDNPADVERVYSHLLSGSYRHLAAFEKQLAADR